MPQDTASELNFRSDDRGFEDANRIETSLGIPVLRHEEKKPGGVMDVLAFFEGKGVNVRHALTATPSRKAADMFNGSDLN